MPMSLSIWQNVCQRTSTANIPDCLQDGFDWLGQNVKGLGFQSLILRSSLVSEGVPT